MRQVCIRWYLKILRRRKLDVCWYGELSETHIGAMVSVAELAGAGSTHPVLAKAANSIASVLIRKSGTEPKIRVMAESYDKILIKKCISKLRKIIKYINKFNVILPMFYQNLYLLLKVHLKLYNLSYGFQSFLKLP